MRDSPEHGRYFTNVYILRKANNLTQEELASLANVSTQLVLRAEQGLHPTLSDKIAHALSGLTSQSAAVIKSNYINERNKNIHDFRDDITSSMDYDNIMNYAYQTACEAVDNPFQAFRVMLFEHYGLPSSAVKFCTYTGLHTAILSSIENRKTTWQEAPALHAVLYNILYVPPKIEKGLGELHDGWYLEA